MFVLETIFRRSIRLLQPTTLHITHFASLRLLQTTTFHTKVIKKPRRFRNITFLEIRSQIPLSATLMSRSESFCLKSYMKQLKQMFVRNFIRLKCRLKYSTSRPVFRVV